jgi:hypothetical protein
MAIKRTGMKLIQMTAGPANADATNKKLMVAARL